MAADTVVNVRTNRSSQLSETEVGDVTRRNAPHSTDTKQEGATMNLNFNNTLNSGNSNEISAQARYLMSAGRQRVQQRRQAMHNRVVAELRMDA